MITRLIIARHGNTFGPGDVVTRVGGRTDLPLVDSGLEQGRMIGRYLKRENLLPDIVFTSNLKRTIQTADEAVAAAGITPRRQPLSIFNEIDYGPDENKPETEVVARLGEDALKAWDTQAVVPDGWKVNPAEIIGHWKAFTEQFIQDHAGKTALVVTSNGIARFAPHLTADADVFRAAHSIKITTGALCLFDHDGTAWTCRAWNLRPKDYLAA